MVTDSIKVNNGKKFVDYSVSMTFEAFLIMLDIDN